MIVNVHKAYTELPIDVCKKVWTTVQLVMNHAFLCNRGNNYKLPHIRKLKLQPPMAVISQCGFHAMH